MRTTLFTVIITLFCFFSENTTAQKVTPIKPDWIDKILQRKTDSIYVINFWATWCKPCVEELPMIERIAARYKDKKVKLILVSNDMKKDVETRLKPFLKEKKIKAEVLWMNEVDANKWINKVSPDWSGAIPATWILKNKFHTKVFKEGAINEDELILNLDALVD